MGITSIGIGSGLDVESIISKMTALEKQPLATLLGKAAQINSRISVVGQIKSQVSALADAASKLAQSSSWTGKTLTSSNSTAVSGSVTSSAAPTSFSVEVQQLARAQSASSTAVPNSTPMGTGTLSIQLGTWNYSASPPTFTPGSASAVNVTIGAGEDSLTSIASKINSAKAGVTATVLRDASGERLLVRSDKTGEESGFRLQVAGDSDGINNDSGGLSRLAFDFDPVGGAYGMAVNSYQKALNTKATINGVAVSSANQTLAEAIPGVTLQFGAETTGPVNVTVDVDQTTIKKNVQDFIAAYNTLAKTLAEATKYDDETKTAGPLQGDAVVLGLQSALRSALGSASTGSTFARLSDVGIQMQRNGMLTLAGSKLDTAMKDVDNLAALFTTDNKNAASNGFGLKIRDLANSLLATGGAVSNKTDALKAALKRNEQDQDKVNLRALQMEKRLRQQYGALDAQMGSLTALSSYMNQQISQWNKSSGG